MTGGASLPRPCRACFLLLLLATTPVFSADPGEISGLVLDASSRPVPGARVLVEDEESRVLLTSAPASEAGEYFVSVLPGRRYRLVGALAPDGTRTPVRAEPPILAELAVRHRLDVHLEERAEKSLPRPADSGKPWYKRPAGITALVVVHVAAAAVILGGTGETPASPFVPAF